MTQWFSQGRDGWWWYELYGPPWCKWYSTDFLVKTSSFLRGKEIHSVEW